MTREAPAPDAPDVLDHLHRKLDLLLGDDAPGSPARRASGLRSRRRNCSSSTNAHKIPVFTNSSTPKKEDPDVKRTLLALDRIQTRLENELDATEVRSERDAGYRAGISEALVQVMETRKSL
ncbi:hypothetical protein GS493_09400 [Rhodococcus hoagii]|nr:hypothetical protein [Prescottella equi]